MNAVWNDVLFYLQLCMYMWASCPIKGTFYCGFFKNSFKFTRLTVVPSNGFDELHSVHNSRSVAIFSLQWGYQFTGSSLHLKIWIFINTFFQKCYFFQAKGFAIKQLTIFTFWLLAKLNFSWIYWPFEFSPFYLYTSVVYFCIFYPFLLDL